MSVKGQQYTIGWINKIAHIDKQRTTNNITANNKINF